MATAKIREKEKDRIYERLAQVFCKINRNSFNLPIVIYIAGNY